jgi:hypothetical protein
VGSVVAIVTTGLILTTFAFLPTTFLLPLFIWALTAFEAIGGLSTALGLLVAGAATIGVVAGAISGKLFELLIHSKHDAKPVSTLNDHSTSIIYKIFGTMPNKNHPNDLDSDVDIEMVDFGNNSDVATPTHSFETSSQSKEEPTYSRLRRS